MKSSLSTIVGTLIDDATVAIMMFYIYKAALIFHILGGAMALGTCFIPIFTKKGGHIHKTVGRYFVLSMYIVLGSGLLMSSMTLIDPISTYYPKGLPEHIQLDIFVEQTRSFSVFLLMILSLAASYLFFAVNVLEAKLDREKLKRPWLIVIFMSPAMMGVIAELTVSISTPILLHFFAIGCVAASINILGDVYKKKVSNHTWVIEHMLAMIACIITVITAFSVVAGIRLTGNALVGTIWEPLPWILPSIVGVPISIWARVKYSKKFKTSQEFVENKMSEIRVS